MVNYLETFDSMSELIDTLDSLPILSESKESETGTESFTGTKTFDEAQKLVYRWDDGADRINRIRSSITDNLHSQGFNYRATVTPPGALHMGRYLEGQPYAYIRRVPNEEKVAGAGNVVRIVVNCAASGSVGARVLETRGGAVLSLIDSLETAGKTVEVVVKFAVTSGSNHFEAAVMVKRAGEPLNLTSISYAVAHPSFLRRHMFRLMETREHYNAIGVERHYGYPAETSTEDGDIYLGRMYGGEAQWNSPRAAAQWVVETLKSQGVTVEA